MSYLKRNTNFRDDLIKYGKPGELIVGEFFKSLGYDVSELNNTYGYDFIITKNGENYKVEVKADQKCITPTLSWLPNNDTGNIFVEYTSWNRPSGIITTKSDIFVYLFEKLKPKELWLIKVAKLKKLIRDNDFKTTKESGDVGSNTEGYLIPRYNFLSDFSLYKNINNEWVKVER